MRNVCSGNAESGFHCDVQPCWTEDKMQFAGESIVIHPGGEIIAKVNDQEQLLTCDIDLRKSEIT